MNKMRLACVMLTLALLAISGCVELTGQRLSFRYDAEKDELTALLFYDGIHDKDESPAQGLTDLADFVKGGDIMLADWFGHIFKPKDMQKELDNPEANLSPAQRQLMQQAVKSIQTHAIGYYRDASGRIGAAQSITISQAGQLVAAFNAWINENLAKEAENDSDNSTARLMHKAAKENHTWLKLDGNSIVFTTPIDRSQWTKMKADFFAEGMMNWGKEGDDQDPAAALRRSIRGMTQFLTSAPISYTEQRGMVSIRLGDPASPGTLRYELRQAYSDNLVEPIKQQIPTDLDAAMAKYLLDEKPAPNADLDAIIAFGPPEQQPAALLGIVKSDPALAPQALKRLQTWAEKWNAAQSYPQAPQNIPLQNNSAVTEQAAPNNVTLDIPAYLKSWDIWLKQMASYPADPPEPATAAQGGASPDAAAPAPHEPAE